jgi:hypothetical protein
MLQQPPDYLGSTADAAAYVGISPRTLIRWRSLRSGPPFIRVGHRICYRKRDLDAWLDGSRILPLREHPLAVMCATARREGASSPNETRQIRQPRSSLQPHEDKVSVDASPTRGSTHG